MPARPPLSTRLVTALGRCGRRLLRAPGVRGRVLPALLVAGALAAVALLLPLVTASAGQPTHTRYAASSTEAGGQPLETGSVVMGVDGRAGGDGPSSSAPAESGGATPGTAADAAGEAARVAPTAESPTASTPPQPAAGAPAPEPADPGTTAPGASPTAPPAAAAPAAAAAPPAAGPRTATATAGTSSPAGPTSTASSARQVLGALDAARAEAGCSGLALDAGLVEEAQRISEELREDAAGGAAEEATAVSVGVEAADAVVGNWLTGAGGQALLDCDATSVGIGRSTGDGGPWWAVVLA